MNKIPVTPEIQNELEVQNKIQTKVLTSTINSDGPIAQLTFNNLVVGNWYSVTGQVTVVTDNGASDTAINLVPMHDGITLGRIGMTLQETADTSTDLFRLAISFKFQATTTTLTFDAESAVAASVISQTGDLGGTYVQIEERNDLVETTDFT